MLQILSIWDVSFDTRFDNFVTLIRIPSYKRKSDDPQKSYKSIQVLYTITFGSFNKFSKTNMKFATAFIVSVLTSSVYGLGPALNVRENVDIEVC